MNKNHKDLPHWVQVLQPLAMGVSLLIALSSAVLTFITSSPQSMKTLVASPMYIIPWILLVILILLFIWNLDLTIKRKGAFLLTHFSFIFLVFAVMVAQVTSRSLELSLPVGGGTDLSQIQRRLGTSQSEGYLILDRFEMQESGDSKKEKLFYRSSVRITNREGVLSRVIEVNHPLKWKGIKVYQVDKSYQITDFAFRFRGRLYVLGRDQDMVLLDGQSNRFVFSPHRLRGDGLEYEWMIQDQDENIVEQGLFRARDLVPGQALYERFGFSIETEEYTRISRLLFSHKPFVVMPALAACIFLLAIFIQFWGIKSVRRQGS